MVVQFSRGHAVQWPSCTKNVNEIVEGYNQMRVLVLGDIVGKPGRTAIAQLLPSLVKRYQLDFVVANGENASGGVGLTTETACDLLTLGIDVLTNGNHIWKYKEVYSLLDKDPRILRPLNYPAGAPGKGYGLFRTKTGDTVGIINLVGRTFMEPVGCPFSAAMEALTLLQQQTPNILVEIHAEATSEKRALGWFLAGHVSAVYGTHTHVPTADEQILAGMTGYITDIGMTGPWDSVIGMRKEDMIQRFRTLRPAPFNVAKDDVRLSGAVFDIDPCTGIARSVERILESLTP
jgi:metallophosphoesterase (TIGR00282 family)